MPSRTAFKWQLGEILYVFIVFSVRQEAAGVTQSAALVPGGGGSSESDDGSREMSALLTPEAPDAAPSPLSDSSEETSARGVLREP